MDAAYCLVGAKIIAGDDCKILDGAAMTIENGRIKAIGTAVPEGIPIINMDGKLLSPMFINSHTHVGDTGAKELGCGIPMEQVVQPPDGLKHQFLKKTDPQLQLAMMRHGLQEMLHNGIIAFADFREQGLDGINLLKEASKNLPIHTIILGRIPEGQDAQHLAYDAEKILEAGDGLGVRQITAYPEQFLTKLRNKHPEKLFAMHVDELQEYTSASLITTGKSEARRAIECGMDVLVHLVHSPREDFSLLRQNNISAVACVRSNAILGEGLPWLGIWIEEQVSFGLGTDNIMLVPPDILGEMQMAGRTACGLARSAAAVDPLTIFKAGTIDGAIALRIDKSLGSLSVGKEASFIVFDLQTLNLTYSNNLIGTIVYRATPADISQIFIKGNNLQDWHL